MQRDETRVPTAAGERGQTLVLVMLFLVALLCFVAVVIEGGTAFLNKRNLQGNADAAALAAAAFLPDETTDAQTAASDYVVNKNSGDGAHLTSVTFAANNTEVEVKVNRTQTGAFLNMLGVSPPTIRASATAKVSKMAYSASRGMLPMALMRDNYTLGSDVEVKFDDPSTGNRGPISPNNNPPKCVKSTGANDFTDMIAGEANGGVDSCAYAPGDTVPTKTGNMHGPTWTGFADRIGSNTDSFEDLFAYDAATGRYAVKTVDSPRVGVVPIVEALDGSTTWPKGTSASVRILGYLICYIGKRDTAGYPPVTGNASVWITPVDAILPEDFADLSDDWYAGSGDEPVAIHLIQ